MLTTAVGRRTCRDGCSSYHRLGALYHKLLHRSVLSTKPVERMLTKLFGSLLALGTLFILSLWVLLPASHRCTRSSPATADSLCYRTPGRKCTSADDSVPQPSGTVLPTSLQRFLAAVHKRLLLSCPLCLARHGTDVRSDLDLGT